MSDDNLAKLEELVNVQKRFAVLNKEAGLIGLAEDYVQLKEDDFRKFFHGQPVRIEWNGDQLETKVDYEGITFLTLF